jgi:predicted DNA-binding transcriptional regulator YafY
MNRVDRLMAYLLLFQSRGRVRAADFAERFEISERTVYRDVQALSEAGVPIVALPGKGYMLAQGYYLPPIAFTPDEAKALTLSLGMMGSLASPGPTRDAASTAMDKIKVILPGATRREVEALLAVVRVYSNPAARLTLDDRKLFDLQRAIQDRRVVHLRYHALTTNQVTERDVEPLELVLADRSWILDAYCRLRQASRGFRLNRIDDYRVLPERYAPRPPEPQERRSDLLRVVVRFDREVIRWVQERQHFSHSARETEAEQAGGSDERLMVYRPRTFDAIDGWLLSWGDAFEVLSPPELRRHLEAVADRIRERNAARPVTSLPAAGRA